MISQCFSANIDEGDHKILQGQQYITFEIATIFKFSPRSILSLMYWSDNGQDYGTISGSFYNIVYERVDIEIGNAVLFTAALQMFYLEYTGNNDGLFISPRIAASVKKIPLSLFFQATQPLTTNVEPNPGFKWNAGLAYIF